MRNALGYTAADYNRAKPDRGDYVSPWWAIGTALLAGIASAAWAYAVLAAIGGV